MGASFDDVPANKKFRDKFEFPYALLCDTDKSLARAYGALKSEDASYPDRITIVIGADGKVRKVYDSVNLMSHVDDVLRDLGGNPPRESLLKKARKIFGR